MHKIASCLLLLGFTFSAACGETTPEPPRTDLGSAGGDANSGGGGAGQSPAPGGAGQTQLPSVGGGGAAVGGANNGGASGGTQSTGGSTQEMGGSGGMQSLGGNGGTPPKPDTEISLQVACDPQAEAMPDLNEILALKADPNRGSAAYLNACSFCHTSGGDGKTLETGVKVPPLKGIPWTCKQVLTLRDGVPKTPMVSFAATHDAQWIADMIAHIQTNF